MIASLPTTATTDSGRRIDTRGQQAGQHSGSRLMHVGASSHFDGFQIQARTFALRGKYYLEERLDFPCDFLMNNSSRFFSTSVQPV